MENKKATIQALALALTIAVLGIGFLAWQYNKVKKVEIPTLEAEIEKQAAYGALQRFMDFRIEGSEDRANLLMTEVAMEGKLNGNFDLLGNFVNYEIVSINGTEEDGYNCLVKIHSNDSVDIIEVINVVKILDSYYINSIDLAG